MPTPRSSREGLEIATFGAGCFWGVEERFGEVRGIRSTAVGYAGGWLPDPTYDDVCADQTGHTEVVQIVYDPSQVSYEELLEVFWNVHDPAAVRRHGQELAAQYRSVIFFHTPEQEVLAKQSRDELDRSGRLRGNVMTAIEPAPTFYRAEEYHQQYLRKQRTAMSPL